MAIFLIILLYLIIGIIIILILNKDHSFQNEIKKRLLKPGVIGWDKIYKKYESMTCDEKESYTQSIFKVVTVLSFIVCVVGWIYIIPKAFICAIIYRCKDKIGIQNALETFEKVKETYDDYDYDCFHYYMKQNGIEYDYEHRSYSMTKKDLYYAMKYVEGCRKYKEESNYDN